MSYLYSVLLNILSEMRKYKITLFFYRFFRRIGLIPLGEYLFDLYFLRNPTRQMKNQMESEKKLFLEHTHELKKIYDFLEDDRSRLAFESILKYRATLDMTYLKESKGKDTLKTQYIVPELQFSNREMIVDCGAYTGDTTKLFYKRIPGCRVIALEPERANFETLQKLKLEGLKIINCGVWSENATLSFSDKGGGSMGGAIDESGNIKIEVWALDDLLECQSATYIKMDIEGAELEALRGAKEIIKRNKPKLAICIYHKPQDMFEIPLYIKELNPDYKMFVHHHSFSRHDTILYCV